MSVYGRPEWSDVPLRLYGEEGVPAPENAGGGGSFEGALAEETSPKGGSKDDVPEAVRGCRSCGAVYDESPEAVAEHTEPVGGGLCCRRCSGKPSCYPCGGMWCTCWQH